MWLERGFRGVENEPAAALSRPFLLLRFTHRKASRAVAPSPPPAMNTVFGLGCASRAGCTSISW